jgi:Fur family ferric uptake transcriptional regulator
MVFTEKRIASILRHNGYRLTAQRRGVLDVIAQTQEHLTPAALYEKVRRRYPGIGLVTVYRTLDLLTQLGLICEVHAGDSCRSYLLRKPSEHHHHLICFDCGTVADFAGCDLSRSVKRITEETGFEVDSHLVEYVGRCRECQKTAVV